MSATSSNDGVDLKSMKVSDAWKRLIRYCETQLPFGELTIKIVNGEPTSLVDFKPNIRFDLPLSASHKETR